MYIGHHLSGTSARAIVEDSHNLGCNVTQICIRSPRKINSPLIKYSNHDYRILKDSNLKIFTHAQYVLDLVKKTDKNNLLKAYSIKSIVNEVLFLKKISGIGTVIHIGSKNPKESYSTACKTTIEYLKKIVNILKTNYNIDSNYRLLIENRAMAGNLIPTNLIEMEELWEWIKVNDLTKYVGICFDTAHDFVTNYKMSFKKMGKRWVHNGSPVERVSNNLLRLINKGIPIDLVHLNDSKSFTKDEHANLFDGHIPEEDIVAVIQICQKNKIPMILERSDANFHDKLKMVNLVKKYSI